MHRDDVSAHKPVADKIRNRHWRRGDALNCVFQIRPRKRDAM